MRGGLSTFGRTVAFGRDPIFAALVRLGPLAYI